METNITPEMLRAIADSLAGDVRGAAKTEFICCAAEYFGDSGGSSISELLDECGIPTLLGDLGLVESSPEWGMSEYVRTAMPIRFMFLEFIALMLEGEKP